MWPQLIDVPYKNTDHQESHKLENFNKSTEMTTTGVETAFRLGLLPHPHLLVLPAEGILQAKDTAGPYTGLLTPRRG